MFKVVGPILVLLALLAFILYIPGSITKNPFGELKLTSLVFKNNERIPTDYTCDGSKSIPLLEISGVSENTKSFVLTMTDPTTSMGEWTHLILYNIPPDAGGISANTNFGKFGDNSWNEREYGLPCPPVGDGEHKYIFKLYALDTVLVFSPLAPINQAMLQEKMDGHIIESTALTGTYSRT